MPCISETTEERESKLRKELDEVTANLCKVMKIVEKSPKTYDKLPSRIRRWHEDHKEFDKKRKTKS